MADRLNDTDPQSPMALTRTDPGLGEPVVLPPRPPLASPIPPPPAGPPASPGSASIEALLDGITGPRPPPSRRDGPDADRVYSAARPVRASQPMPPMEPLVVSPGPPHYSGTGHDLEGSGTGPDLEATAPRPGDPGSTRPVVRAEERTVYTGRRALLRNLAVAVASSLVMALMMMTIMRWRESQRPRRASAVVVLPAVPDMELPPPVPAAPPLVPVAAAGVVTEPPPAPAAPSLTVTAAVPRPAVAGKRGKGEAKSTAPPASSLDDLNREIRH